MAIGNIQSVSSGPMWCQGGRVREGQECQGGSASASHSRLSEDIEDVWQWEKQSGQMFTSEYLLPNNANLEYTNQIGPTTLMIHVTIYVSPQVTM